MTADNNFSRPGSGSASQQGSQGSQSSQGSKGSPGSQFSQSSGGSGSSSGRGSSGQSGGSGKGGGEQLKSQVQQAGKEIGQKAEQSAENAKSRVANQVRAIAGAMRSASDELRKNDQAGIAQAAQRLEEKVEKAAEFLRNKSPGEMRDDLENAARREPIWFLGGAFLLGLVAARFMKSTGQSGAGSIQNERDWSRSRSLARGGTSYGLS